jgi:hypothetical protein
MVEVLSISIQIWNIKTCQSHFKKGSKGRGKSMEGMNIIRVQYIYVHKCRMKPPVQLSYTTKNV